MGAWIEIKVKRYGFKDDYVAPHDGCVDWNINESDIRLRPNGSHPTMGAWIEIMLPYYHM